MKEYELIRTPELIEVEIKIYKARILLSQTLEAFDQWLDSSYYEHESGVEFEIVEGSAKDDHFAESIYESIEGVVMARCDANTKIAYILIDLRLVKSSFNESVSCLDMLEKNGNWQYRVVGFVDA